MITWKPVPKENFAKYNEVSDQGEVRKRINHRILPSNIRNGYYSVSLYNNDTKKSLTASIHRLVAMAFISNPDNKKCVNHINGIKTDNRVENLEWVSYKENTKHAAQTKLWKPNTKKVDQYTKDDVYITTFQSIKEAENKTGVPNRQISKVCRGKAKTAYGFIWKYTEGFDFIDNVEGIVIKDFPNYKLTKDGKVYSSHSKRFLKPKIMDSGYKTVKLCNNGKMVDTYICKLMREYYDIKTFNPKSKEKSFDGSGENSEV